MSSAKASCHIVQCLNIQIHLEFMWPGFKPYFLFTFVNKGP